MKRSVYGLLSLLILICGTMNAQNYGASIPAGFGPPASLGIVCNASNASSTSSSLFNDRSITTGNSVWKCSLAADGVTYSWVAPFTAPTAYTLSGAGLSLRCAYGTVTTNTSGTATVSYAAMNFATVYWITSQSVASGTTAATSNNATISNVTTVSANISVTTPTTVSILGALSLQLTSAAIPVYVQVCGV